MSALESDWAVLIKKKLCAVNILSKERAKTLTRNGTEAIICLDIVSIVHW